MRRIVILALSSVPCFSQQQTQPAQPNFVISGIMQGEDGSLIKNGIVSMHLRVPAPGAKLTHVSRNQAVGPLGTFSFDKLDVGQYILCAQAPKSTWLDPCEWGLKPPVVTVSTQRTTVSVVISMKKGVAVPFRLNDPGQLLPQNEGKTAGAHVLVGVGSDAGTFRMATVTGQDATGRDHQLVIPFNSPVRIIVYSTLFHLADRNGIVIPRNYSATPVLIPSGQQPPSLQVTVIGMGRP